MAKDMEMLMYITRDKDLWAILVISMLFFKNSTSSAFDVIIWFIAN